MMGGIPFYFSYFIYTFYIIFTKGEKKELTLDKFSLNWVLHSLETAFCFSVLPDNPVLGEAALRCPALPIRG